MSKRIVIVGGVAGGASAATRARRLDEHAEIVIIERGPYVSFANCGLPYHLGGVIAKRESLLLQTPESLKSRFNLSVLTNHDALGIDRAQKQLKVRNLNSGEEFSLSYDKLILSPGAEPFVPPLAGVDMPGVFTLRTIPDLDRILEFVRNKRIEHATVVGGGFIGLETAENLVHRGIRVSLIEKDIQVLPPLDPEMASDLHGQLRLHGVNLHLNSQATELVAANSRICIKLQSDLSFETDLVILSIGVRPEVKLARDAGIEIGSRGGISTNDFMQTSDPDIYAVGDAAETRDSISGIKAVVPLAGPANRQGRSAGENAISSNNQAVYPGTMGTWICKVFDLTVAQTGNSEKTLKRNGAVYRKIYLHPAQHASYYPNATAMCIKLLFNPNSEEILGAQIVGREGVDKRIDVLATAIFAKLKVSQLAHLELAYAPPYGSAKDPINQAGMIAHGLINGNHRGLTPDELLALPKDSYTLIDVRTALEYQQRAISGSVNIPVDELRNRLGEISRDREVIVHCQVGLRGYMAQRILSQHGFMCRNLIGGLKSYLMFNHSEAEQEAASMSRGNTYAKTPGIEAHVDRGAEVIELDACGLQCPGPLVLMAERIKELKRGDALRVTATDPGFLKDVASWCARAGHRLLEAEPILGKYRAVIEKGGEGNSQAASAPSVCEAGSITQKNKLTMVVFSNDLDRAYAAFIIATGAASMGMEVTLFFTFWGLNILRAKDHPPVSKDAMAKMFGMMMPKGAAALSLSKMHLAGIGTAMMKHIMSEKNVAPLPDLIAGAQAAGVKFIACSMSMDVMGIKKSELIPGVEEGGVASYIDSAAGSGINLFI